MVVKAVLLTKTLQINTYRLFYCIMNLYVRFKKKLKTFSNEPIRVVGEVRTDVT